ncbi:hypothetical protein [Okeania sp.]|uniref:hypothetical protein n=1 Tax=Okeania sp. TaxID=3100323 RepID=UPI002B4B2B84|nr:hypothetical protein [Okeania sp.]MEB3340835.1 hypothetical protein [Okeania sp.]
MKRYGVVSQIYRNHKYDFDDKLMLTATVPVELISDGSISNQITQEIYQFSFEFFSNLSYFPTTLMLIMPFEKPGFSEKPGFWLSLSLVFIKSDRFYFIIRINLFYQAKNNTVTTGPIPDETPNNLE